MDQEKPQFDFLKVFIEKMLDENGFAELPETTRQQFVPTLEAEAGRRLTLGLLPLLNEDKLKELAKLTKSSASAEAQKTFWLKAIPDFENQARAILEIFISEFKKNLAKFSK